MAEVGVDGSSTFYAKGFRFSIGQCTHVWFAYKDIVIVQISADGVTVEGYKRDPIQLKLKNDTERVQLHDMILAHMEKYYQLN